MSSEAKRGVVWLSTALFVLGGQLGCEQKLEQGQCDEIRVEAFQHLTGTAHTCNSDADCEAAEWPDCTKPVNTKNMALIRPLWDKFKKGKCEEPPNKRPCGAEEVYCKQGLCVTRHKAGGQ